MEDLVKNMAEYQEKVTRYPSPENLERYRQIKRTLFDINRRILSATIEIDRSAVTLTRQEKERINDDEQQDRILQRVIPIMIMQQYLEHAGH
jgi:hypothetical protein